MTARSKAAGALLLAAAVVATGALPAAHASCAQPIGTTRERIDAADPAFVGTVARTDSRDRRAYVHVEEVWRGTVANEVTVTGGETAENTFSSADRSYTVGGRYLFTPSSGSGAEFQDHACSETRPYDDEAAAARPATAKPVPQPTPSDALTVSTDAEPVASRTAATAAGGLAALVGASGLYVWGRGRRKARYDG